MLTVKLYRGRHMKIVEAETIHIYPTGKAAPAPEGEPAPLTNRVRGISCVRGGKAEDVYVGHADEPNPLNEERWDYAYIENAHGATTERVYASS